MYIGNRRLSEKEKVLSLAKNNLLSGLRRVYDFYTSLFTALLISLLLFSFEFVRDVSLSFLSFYEVIINLVILLMIMILFVAVSNSRDEYFFAIKIREQKLLSSRRKAFALIDSYSIKNKN